MSTSLASNLTSWPGPDINRKSTPHFRTKTSRGGGRHQNKMASSSRSAHELHGSVKSQKQALEQGERLLGPPCSSLPVCVNGWLVLSEPPPNSDWETAITPCLLPPSRIQRLLYSRKTPVPFRPRDQCYVIFRRNA